MSDEKENNNVTPEVPQEAPNDAVMERIQQIEDGLKVQLEEKDAQIAELQQDIKNAARNNNQPQDDVVDTARRSAHIISLPVIEGSPIIKSEMSSVLGVKGLEMIAKVENAAGEKFEVPFGCDIKRLDFSDKSLKDLYKTSYENLSAEKFELVDIDENDLTGASKVEKGLVSSEGTLIPEIDRSTGTPIATGRKVRTTVRKDVRHYSFMADGKKVILTNEELANIRV
jgi:hypothetical protein